MDMRGRCQQRDRLWGCSEGCVPWEMMQGAHSLPGFGSFVTFRAQSHLIAADN